MLFNPITSDDHLRRIEKTRRLMKEKDLDLLIVFGDNFHVGNCRYLSGSKPCPGWDSSSYAEGYGTELVSVPATGDIVLWVFEPMVPWVKDELASIGLYGEPWIRVKSLNEFFEEIQNLTKSAKRIAYEGRNITPWPIYDKIRKKFGAELPETDIVELQRRVKDQKEIKLLEIASRINDQICEELVSGIIRFGVTEKEIVRKICELAYSMGAETCDANFMISDDLGWAHSRDKTIDDGDLLSLHVIVSYEGYFSDNDRVFGFGNISKRDEELARACKLAFEAGLKTIKPGIVGHEAMEAAWAAHEFADHSKWSLDVGHSIGLEGEELASWKDWTLEKDMVLCFSPGACCDGRTWATEDVIHITASGARLLTKFPVDYVVQRVRVDSFSG